MVCLLKKTLFLIGISCLFFTLCIVFPVLAATVTCPSTCSCLLPAEANKLGYSGYCGGKQMICGYDAYKNEKYCYEKPVTTAPVPVTCPASCSCFTPEQAKQLGYSVCGGKQILCGYDKLQNAEYCYEKPVTTAPVPVTCPASCSCFTLDEGTKRGYSLCNGKLTLCGYSATQQPEYCHTLPTTVTTTPAPISVTLVPPVYVTALTPVVTVPLTPPLVAGRRCMISGSIYNFYHNASSLKVQFTPAGAPPSDASVSPVMAGDLVDHYSYLGIASCDGVVEVQPVYRPAPDVCPWTGTFLPSRGTTVTMSGESQSGWDFTYQPTDSHIPEVAVSFSPTQPRLGATVTVTVQGRDDTAITFMKAKTELRKNDGTITRQPWTGLSPEADLIRRSGDLPSWSDTFTVSGLNVTRLDVTARVCDPGGNERWGSGSVQFGSCDDFIMNRDEEQIDCGGTYCPACLPCTWCGPNVIPLRINGRTASKIDVVFIPDEDYGGDMARFVSNVQDTIINGYYRNTAIEQNRTKFNFYYLNDDADITAYPACGFNPPLGSCEAFQDATTFADSLPVVHTTNFRDWSGTACERRVFCSEPTSYRTFVHESGHSLFGLKDEYCCDSHYSQNDPNPNIWSSLSNCQSDAGAMGWNTGDCSNFCTAGSGNCGSGYWDIDPAHCVMACSQSCTPAVLANCGPGDPMCQYEPACLRRVNNVFGQYP